MYDEHLDELQHLLEQMREDFEVGDCFSAQQRLDEVLKLLTENRIPDSPDPIRQRVSELKRKLIDLSFYSP